MKKLITLMSIVFLFNNCDNNCVDRKAKILNSSGKTVVITSFKNYYVNVPFGTLSKKTEIPKDESIELVNKICPPSVQRVSIVDLIMGDSIVIDFGDRKLRYGRIASLRNPYTLEFQNLDSDNFTYTLTPEDYANALP